MNSPRSHQALERTLRAVQPPHRPLVLPGGRRAGQPVMLTEWGGISTEQETNGLLTAGRAHKLGPAAVGALTARAAAAVPGEVISTLQLAHEVTSFQG